MELKDALSRWDGNSVGEIEDIYSRHCKTSEFVPIVIELLEDKELQSGASWLLKKHLESKNLLNSKTIQTVYESVSKLVTWEAKLHILQCIPYLPIPFQKLQQVEEFLRDCLADKNKFVRAWAYGGFYELADRFPEFRDEAEHLIDVAMHEESASVKARIRNATKKGFLNEGK